jgi:hypothetical protein
LALLISHGPKNWRRFSWELKPKTLKPNP